MFRILKSIELQGWREQVMDMPLVQWLTCPCDGTELRTVAAIVGDDRKAIRIGACQSCGYFGYQDRPTAEWFNSFYATDWDQNRDADALIAKIRNEGLRQQAPPMYEAVKKIPFDVNAKVFEMGTGYGWSLRCMYELGYRQLSGIESCPHRARVAREGFGLDVRHESLETHSGGPYDLVLSFHVLEHCYDPAEIVAKLASIQKPGGHLVLGVPNAAGEPTMGVVGFLPHLHSFSVRGLRCLLERYGYEIVEYLASHESQIVTAKFTGKRLKVIETNDVVFEECLHKIRRGLTHEGSGYFCWRVHNDTPLYCDSFKIDAMIDWGNDLRFLQTDICRERYTDAPVEIQWEGPTRLFVK